jgi:ankyrin repeat protein
MNSIDEELFEAVEENNLPEVSRPLGVGADVNAKDTDLGRTPLIEACSYGHMQVFQALLEHGADIEAKDSDGWTPLHWACAKNRVAVVVELLNPGDEIHANDSDGTTTTILGKRKRRGADTEAKNRYGDTPLHKACFNGHLAVVKALVSGGANILAANNRGKLLIYEAMRKGKAEVAKYLLQVLYATTRRLPLHELLEDLTWIGNPYSSDVPPLRETLQQEVLGTDDVVEILEYLTKRNPALLSSHDQDGSLPLHVACRRGAAFTIVQSLVDLYKASVKSMTCRHFKAFVALVKN